MSPTDRVAVAHTEDGRDVKIRCVLLEADEKVLLWHTGGGWVSGVPMPLCDHDHERMDEALRCGLDTAHEMTKDQTP